MLSWAFGRSGAICQSRPRPLPALQRSESLVLPSSSAFHLSPLPARLCFLPGSSPYPCHCTSSLLVASNCACGFVCLLSLCSLLSDSLQEAPSSMCLCLPLSVSAICLFSIPPSCFLYFFSFPPPLAIVCSLHADTSLGCGSQTCVSPLVPGSSGPWLPFWMKKLMDTGP